MTQAQMIVAVIHPRLGIEAAGVVGAGVSPLIPDA